MKEQIRLLHSGEEFFARLEGLISSAASEIYFQTYIFLNDHAGRRIANALAEAARRKVSVFLLLDAYGSRPLTAELRDQMEKAGVQLRFFAPLFSWNTLYIGRRLHHKAFVADGKTAVLGGINISDHYLGTAKENAWLDYAVEFSAEAAEIVLDICRTLHHRKRAHKKDIVNDELRIIRNDWLKKKNEIYQSYIKAIRGAEKEVVILGGYFLPGRRLGNAIIRSAKSGVKIKVIVAGVSDVPFVRSATRYLYTKLDRSGVELYEWTGSVLHGKAAVVDRNWCTIGSFNLNNLSSYASLEMNAEIRQKSFIAELSEELKKIMLASRKIDVNKAHGPLQRFFYWFSYSFISSISILMTFFSYRRVFRHFRPD